MRNITLALSVATFCITAGSAAFGQESSGQAMGRNMATMNLPEQCQQAEGGQMPAMAGLDMSGMDMSGMDESQQENMKAMMEMHPAMMQGMMADDPDVAFACGMIAHHRGAIDMAEVELKYGDDDEMKQMAQKIIDDQTREIAEFTAWLEASSN